MPKQPSPSVITQAMMGDRQAFRSLVEDYQGFLYAVAYRYLGQAAEAEDAVQETFVKLWKNLSSYRPEVKFTTWLFKILVNHCLDVQKSSVMRAQRKQVDLEKMVQVANPTGSDLWESREIMEAITEAASQLSGKQKMIFVLRDLQGMEVAEVCVLMGVTEDQIKSNLYHARRKISEYLRSSAP